MGVAFTNIETGQNKAYFPAVSLEKGMRVVFNFGQIPFNQTINGSISAVNEPDCLINNYYKSSIMLVDQFKNYIMAFNAPEYKHVSQDERFLVGSVILEYLTPLLADDYVFKNQIMDFFSTLMIIKKPDLIKVVFQTFEMHYSVEQLREFVGRVVTYAVRNLL